LTFCLGRAAALPLMMSLQFVLGLDCAWRDRRRPCRRCQSVLAVNGDGAN